MIFLVWKHVVLSLKTGLCSNKYDVCCIVYWFSIGLKMEWPPETKRYLFSAHLGNV